MINYKIVAKILGILLFLEAILLLGCSIFPICFGESDLVPFLASAGITCLIGLILFWIGHDADKKVNRKDGYIIVTFSWVLFSLRALPRECRQRLLRDHVRLHHHRCHRA